MEKKLIHEEVIQPGSAWGGNVKKGQYLRVIDLMGQQVGDLVLFNAENTKECNCHGITRSRQFLGKPGTPYKFVDKVTIGNTIYSTAYQPMAIMTADTPVKKGVHDMYLHMCNKKLYEHLGHPNRDGCWEAECRALSTYGILPEQIPDPLNLFMNLEHDVKNGTFIIHSPISRPGDYVEFQMEMDCTVGLACCPQDVGAPVNGDKPTPLKIQVYGIN